MAAPRNGETDLLLRLLITVTGQDSCLAFDVRSTGLQAGEDVTATPGRRLLLGVGYWMSPCLGRMVKQVRFLPPRLAFLTRNVTRLLQRLNVRLVPVPEMVCDAHGGHFVADFWEAS